MSDRTLEDALRDAKIAALRAENARLKEELATPILVATNRLVDSLADARAESAAMREALEFYAAPETYFAVSIWADPPCGAIVDDYSDTDMGERLGKRARAALSRAAAPEPDTRGPERCVNCGCNPCDCAKWPEALEIAKSHLLNAANWLGIGEPTQALERAEIAVGIIRAEVERRMGGAK